MAKKPSRSEDSAPRSVYESPVRPPSVPTPQRQAETKPLIELKPGLFLNMDHIVTVRVLSQEEGDTYAIMHLSNGDKQNLTRSEFTEITGLEPRLPARLLQKPQVK